MTLTAAQIRKGITAFVATLVGAATEALNLGLVHGTAARAWGVAIPFITMLAASYGVWKVPNEPMTSTPSNTGPPTPPAGPTAPVTPPAAPLI